MTFWLYILAWGCISAVLRDRCWFCCNVLTATIINEQNYYYYYYIIIIFHRWPKLTRAAVARSLCDSWATCWSRL